MASVNSTNPFLLSKRQSSLVSRDEFSRKKIKQWVDALSIGNVEQDAFELYGKLDHLNRLEVASANRFELLGLLQPAIDYVLDSLKQNCTQGAIPLNIGTRMLADLRQDILIQMVKAYKTVLAQLHDATVTGLLFHKHTRAEALRRALFYLGEILLHSYITYQPCLSYTWKELHGIYYYSVVNELQTTKDIEVNSNESDQPGIEDLYKQILLLSLANPYSMLRGEADRVNTILRKWVAFVDLLPLTRRVAAESYFLIDAQNDGMPCAPNLCKKQKIKIGWHLVTDHLEKVLEKKLATAEASLPNMRPTDAGALRMMLKLKDAWSQQIRPRELRNNTSSMAEIICGLDKLYLAHGGAMLSETISDQSMPGAAWNHPGHHMMDSSILDNDEVLIEVEPGILELHRVNEAAEGYRLEEIGQARIDGKECITANRSENGYCLNWPDSGEGGTWVGELVGVSAKSDQGESEDLNFGVIRWMYAGHSGFLGMGVELLHGIIEPIILQRRNKGAKQPESMNAFLQHAEGGDHACLITPPFYAAEQDRYKLVTGSEEIPINLTNIVESTDSFVRFNFTPAAGNK